MPIRYLNEVRVPPGRVRKEFTEQELNDLAASILEVGLLHPPVVEDDGSLLAGERRFRALTLLSERGETYHCNGKWISPGLIMTTDIRELTRSQRLQAEIDENTIRVDISWQEKAEATARLHELRQLQRDTTAVDEGGEPSKQTPTDTAAELRGKEPEQVTGREVADVRADLMVQTWLSNHPDDLDVAGARSRAEALRQIEIKMENEHRESLARRFLARKPSEGHVIELADLRAQLPLVADAQFDAIITDPPWGVDSHTWTNQESIRQHTYLDDMHTFETIHECIAKEGFRVCKPRAHLYLFCAHRKFETLAKLFRSVGWDVWPQPLIWWKGSNVGIAPRPEHGPRNTYECILFANKGNKRVLALRPDVLLVPQPTTNVRAAEKPAGIYWECLSRSCLPGDEVLDPCCGTGPLLPAANALKLRATLYDVAPDAIGLASQRLAEQFVPMPIKAFEAGTIERQSVGRA